LLIIKPLVKKISSINSGEFRDSVQKLIDSGTSNIIINLSMVEYMDSSGLGSLASIYNYLDEKATLRTERHRLALCCLQNSVDSIYSIFKMSTFVPAYKNEDEAMNTF
jgi:anti-sigma B factor antagonist